MDLKFKFCTEFSQDMTIYRKLRRDRLRSSRSHVPASDDSFWEKVSSFQNSLPRQRKTCMPNVTRNYSDCFDLSWGVRVDFNFFPSILAYAIIREQEEFGFR